EEIQAAIESMKTDQWTFGPKVKQFEKEFAKEVGSKYAVMVNSGSSANLVAITAMFFREKNPLKRGDEVLVPAVAWATTWSPLWQLGLKVRVVDVDPESINATTEAYRKAITPNTKVLIAVSILGNPCDLQGMRDLCKEKNLIFMEDNCESIAATVGGKQAGTFGDIGTFSFFYSHHISTIEGGMVCTDDEQLYHISLALRAHGWTRDLPEKSFLRPKSDSTFPGYEFQIPGYNVRPIEISAAIGSVQLKKMNGMLVERRKNAKLFQEMMSGHPSFIIQKEKWGESSWFAFTLLLKSGTRKDRDKLYEFLKADGIESRMITGGSFLKHDMAKFFDVTTVAGTPEADRIHDLGVFVGNFDRPMTAQLEKLDSRLGQFEKTHSGR
ncbi:MAG: DegT/DnrJ/EryC1/StrS family aminotransferase, partial [Bdellovibrionota bacterium]